MPRSNRYFNPGNIWHITHRCHKKDYLLRFGRDRQNWIHWLYEGRIRYNVDVLNYMVTCNHIHLLVQDNTGNEIPEFMQLIQSRTAQAYNLRKKRRGAFWEDRYHATAIDSGVYLLNCINYINMNMVRAGTVIHPKEWKDSGYYDIEFPKKRYRIINYPVLLNLLGIKTQTQLKEYQRNSIQEIINNKDFTRDSKWSESLAVGSESFVNKIKTQLSNRARSSQISMGEEDCFELSESEIPYNVNFDTKNMPLRLKKATF